MLGVVKFNYDMVVFMEVVVSLYYFGFVFVWVSGVIIEISGF